MFPILMLHPHRGWNLLVQTSHLRYQSVTGARCQTRNTKLCLFGECAQYDPLSSAASLHFKRKMGGKMAPEVTDAIVLFILV